VSAPKLMLNKKSMVGFKSFILIQKYWNIEFS